MLLLSLLLNGSRGSAACSKVLVQEAGLKMMLLTAAEWCHWACWAVVRVLLSLVCRVKLLRRVL